MRHRIVRGLAPLVVVAALALASPCGAARARLDARAQELLHAMSDYLAGLQAFELTADATFDRVLEGGQKLESRERLRLAVRRPANLREDISGDTGGRALRYDGRQFSVVDSGRNLYASTDTDDSIDSALIDLWTRYRISIPLGELALADPFGALGAKIENSTYVGLSEVGGKRAHHLAFQQPTVDWQVWIDAGDAPLPLRWVITYKTVPQAPQYRAELDGWRTDPVFSEREFVFVVPEDAEEVPMLNWGSAQTEDLP